MDKAPRAPIALLTDFGTSDVYVGVMKGVIAGIAPDAPVVDLTHDVPPQDVRAGACALLFSYRYFPAGTVFCCVVDPGVGSTRAAVAAKVEVPGGAAFLVCPDNGLATPLLSRIRQAVVLDDPRYHLPAVSATFHGRDVFAPVAAQLAAGTELTALGTAVDHDRLVRLVWPEPLPWGSGWVAEVMHVDRFGNLITNLEGARLPRERNDVRVRVGGRLIEGLGPTFAAVEIGEPVAYVGSSGFLEVAIRQGNASRHWGVNRGTRIDVELVR